ncbi:MAG: hypothetical protein RJA98_1942 [Pseudomonadota bacterium]
MTELATPRRATLADVPAIAVLFDAYRQFYEQTPDLPAAEAFILQRLQRQESVILLAETATVTPGVTRAHTVVGFCQLYPSFCSVEAAPIYTLYDLFVVPESRRTGAGRTLLLAADQHARAAGAVRMDLTTARTNARAQALYESLGWQRDEVFLAYNLRMAPR